MSTGLDIFQEFQSDHRVVRDLVLDLARSIVERDLPTARTQLGELNRICGPHFRFEEESLYPALRPFFSDYVDKLYADHDGAIETAESLVEFVSRDEVTPEEAQAARLRALSLLIHVSDCQGLAIIMERMPQSDLDRITERMVVARREGKSLLDWAKTIRQRAA